jgi:hypothetical protein
VWLVAEWLNSTSNSNIVVIIIIVTVAKKLFSTIYKVLRISISITYYSKQGEKIMVHGTGWWW